MAPKGWLSSCATDADNDHLHQPLTQFFFRQPAAALEKQSRDDRGLQDYGRDNGNDLPAIPFPHTEFAVADFRSGRNSRAADVPPRQLPRVDVVSLPGLVFALDRFGRFACQNLQGDIRGGNAMLLPAIHVPAHDTLTQIGADRRIHRRRRNPCHIGGDLG